MRTASIYNFLLEANLMASAAIMLMMILRKFLRRPLGSRALCWGWLMVAVRLLCPLALPNPFMTPLRPFALQDEAIRPIGGQLLVRTRDAVGDIYFAMRRHGVMEENPLAQGLYQTRMGLYNGSAAKTLMVIYLIGVLAVTAYFVYSNVRFCKSLIKNRVETLTGEQKEIYAKICREMKCKMLPVYYADPLSSACLVGVIRPWIALPLTAKPEDLPLILTHEMQHYRGKDHWFALVRLLCCCVHWMNPLVWAAVHMSRMDMELKCDEMVTEKMADEEKKQYAAMLIAETGRRSFSGMQMLATGMSFSGKRLKNRVKQILAESKKIKALSVGFVLLAGMLLISAFATAEYLPEPKIPVFQADMLPDMRLVQTEDDAIQYAKELSQGPLIQFDGDEVAWEAEMMTQDEKEWWITANGNVNTFYAKITEDGRVTAVGQEEPHLWREGRAYIKRTMNQPWKEEATSFIRQMVETLNPSLKGEMRELEWIDDVVYEGKRYVYCGISTPGIPKHDYVWVALEVFPKLRIIEYGPGNG